MHSRYFRLENTVPKVILFIINMHFSTMGYKIVHGDIYTNVYILIFSTIKKVKAPYDV